MTDLDKSRPIVSTIHVDLYDLEGSEELLDAIASLVYGRDLDSLVYAHGQSCEESDHCCGPGSNYLRAALNLEESK